ncbi:hypothetical protein [Microbacterium sp. GXF7504]
MALGHAQRTADLCSIDELIHGLDLAAWADGWSFDFEGLDTRELIAFLSCTAVLFPLMDADEGIMPGVPLPSGFARLSLTRRSARHGGHRSSAAAVAAWNPAAV